MTKVRIIWKYTQNLGEEFDNEERFCGNKTKTTLQEDIVSIFKAKERMDEIREIPADYGDGVTNSKIIAVVDEETKECLPLDDRFWEIGEVQ